MPLKVYEYSGCSTCRNAIKFLESRKITHVRIPVRESPPSKKELKILLAAVGNIRKLFNSSGQDYRRLKISEKLNCMSESEALDLLASNGYLVKRPIVLGDGVAIVGFREEEWKKFF